MSAFDRPNSFGGSLQYRTTGPAGSLGRNVIRAPGDFDLDLAVGREFPMRERLKLRVRAQAFKLLNHANLQAPNTSLTVTTNAAGQPIFSAPGLGLITPARAARFLQLVAHRVLMAAGQAWHCCRRGSMYTPSRYVQNLTRISKWGNSLAVRIPLALAKQADLNEGEFVSLVLDRDRGIVLQPTRRRYELAELVAGITPKNRHRETNWGRPQGEESW